ncbi:MAG: transcription elongation factor GreA [Polyangiales bacterium]
MDKVPMTPQGHAALTEELAKLKIERPKISAEIGVAREHGDLKENAEYHAAREKQGLAEARIREIEDKLSRAEVIDSSSFSGDRVSLAPRSRSRTWRTARRRRTASWARTRPTWMRAPSR